MNIEKIIIDRFQKEIKGENFFSSNKEYINQFINTICSSNAPYDNMFDKDETRNLFDKGLVNIYFKIVAFVAISKDDTDLYAYLIDNMKWKKGSEITAAYDAQSLYIQEFKPKNITQWFFNNHKKYSGMMSILGVHFLYCVENESKAITHKITNSSAFSTNSPDVYNFLAQTKNMDLFEKIMKKHMRIFGSYTENIIFKKIDQNKRYDMLALIYEFFVKPKNKLEIIQYIDSLHKTSHSNIAIFFKSTYFKNELEQNLNVQSKTNSKNNKI